MRTKKVGRIDLTDGGDQFYSKTGMALGYYFVFTGSNATGETGTAADLGRIITQRDGDPKDNVEIEALQKIMNTRSGISVLDSTQGGNFEASVFLPNFEESFPSAYNITSNDELEIELQVDDAVIATRFDSLQVEVYMREAAIPERYPYGISSKTFNYGAAVNNDPNSLGKKNVTTVYVDDPSDILDQLSIEQDGQTELDGVDPAVLRAITLQENTIENSTFDFPKQPLYTPSEVGTLYSDTTSVTLTVSGAGNINVIMGKILQEN